MRPGYLYFPKSTCPEGLPAGQTWLEPSTFSPHGRAVADPLQPSAVCPHCFLQRPLSGGCDCED